MQWQRGARRSNGGPEVIGSQGSCHRVSVLSRYHRMQEEQVLPSIGHSDVTCTVIRIIRLGKNRRRRNRYGRGLRYREGSAASTYTPGNTACLFPPQRCRPDALHCVRREFGGVYRTNDARMQLFRCHTRPIIRGRFPTLSRSDVSIRGLRSSCARKDVASAASRPLFLLEKSDLETRRSGCFRQTRVAKVHGPGPEGITSIVLAPRGIFLRDSFQGRRQRWEKPDG